MDSTPFTPCHLSEMQTIYTLYNVLDVNVRMLYKTLQQWFLHHHENHSEKSLKVILGKAAKY